MVLVDDQSPPPATAIAHTSSREAKMDFDHLVRQKKIYLWNKGLRDGELSLLTNVIQGSYVLEELNLGDNQLTLADGRVTDAITRSRTLRVLNLEHNQIDPKGAKRLAVALKVNNTLQRVFLSGNQIGGEGTKGLADALKTNHSLRVLDLRGNKIDDEGAQSLADLFEINESLREVHLCRNSITDMGAHKLADAIEKNYSINKLEVDNNRISSRVDKTIKDILNDDKRRQIALEIGAKDDKIEKQEIMAPKNEQIASLLSIKYQELVSKEAEIVKRKEELTVLRETIDMLKKSIKAPGDQQKMVGISVELDGVGEAKPLNKRPRTENTIEDDART